MSNARVLNLFASLALVFVIWPLDIGRLCLALFLVLICETTQWHMGKSGEK